MENGLGWACLFATPALVMCWYYVRYFLVEFVGDVAIYVSAYSANRFWEVREAIQNQCRKALLALYDAKDSNGHFEYDQVIVLGHSLLGLSWLTTLSMVLVEDILRTEADRRLFAGERTRLFLTFGSPLDKVTYLFRAQAANRDFGTRWTVLGHRWHRALMREIGFRGSIYIYMHIGTTSAAGSTTSIERHNRGQGDPPAVENRVELNGSRWNPVAGPHKLLAVA